MIEDENSFKRLMALSRQKRIDRRSLDEVRQLSKLLSGPEKGLKVVHVAGTNGKGSVCLALSHILRKAGYKVGLFTSPHVDYLGERIQINGQEIDKAILINKLTKVLNLVEEKGLSVHFFDVLTVLCFSYFQEMDVDVAVIETGLGGEMDATNIVEPLVCAITSLGMDHMEVLGGSLTSIARAKAGIIKRGVPVVLGSTSVHEEVLKKAYALGAFMHRVKQGPAHQENLHIAQKLALLLIERGFVIGDKAMTKGLEKPLAYRYQQVGPVILDGAHNGPALRALFKRVKQERKFHEPLQVIVATSKARLKDAIEVFKDYGVQCHVWPHHHDRLISGELLAAACKKEGVDAALYASKKECLQGALKQSASARILATGSFYILAEVKKQVLTLREKALAI